MLPVLHVDLIIFCSVARRVHITVEEFVPEGTLTMLKANDCVTDMGEGSKHKWCEGFFHSLPSRPFWMALLKRCWGQAGMSVSVGLEYINTPRAVEVPLPCATYRSDTWPIFSTEQRIVPRLGNRSKLRIRVIGCSVCCFPITYSNSTHERKKSFSGGLAAGARLEIRNNNFK